MRTNDFIRQTPYIAWALMFATLCWGLFSNFYGSLTPEISVTLSLTPQNLGALIMLMSAGGALGAFLGGDIAQRFAPAPLLMVYLALVAVSLVLIVSSGDFALVCVGYCLYSATSTAIITVSHSMLAHLNLSDGIRPRLLALLDVGFSVGATISPLWVTLLLMWHHDWRLPYVMFALPLLIIAASLLHRKARADFAQIVTDTAANQSHNHTNGTSQSSYLAVIRAPWARWTWLCGILIGYAEWGNAYWFVNYATNGREIDVTHARIGLAAFTGGMLIIRIWQAFYHSRWSNEQRMKRLTVVGTAMFIVLLALPNHAHVLFVSMVSFMAGLGIGIIFPMLLNHLIEQVPHDASKCSALLMLCIILGSQLGGLIIGFFATHVGIFAGYATISIAMVGFTYGIWRVYGEIKTPSAPRS
ncbi:hypothetical protein GCM10009007_18600 [Formosimonas limnophila]|uniref:Major facilitator superfamily (MFS) profile domain-containing protein n=1 Tax=Formosimonas limnophila TaxID=1384487 RepID=A0A8J3CNT6_9BURK|nr:MFS transporter [Formosimonas limnophila]GHA77911.1 hypothetical protein GCM10009007_18600 [Formosimonas limnophila]